MGILYRIINYVWWMGMLYRIIIMYDEWGMLYRIINYVWWMGIVDGPPVIIMADAYGYAPINRTF